MKTAWIFVMGSVAFTVGLGVSAANAQKIYWTNGPNEIVRANLDGSDIEVVTTEAVGGIAIALDVAGGKIYWTVAVTDKIQRANLDGTDAEDLVTGVGSSGIALDVGAGKMYWTARPEGKIQRANLEIPTGQTPDNRTDIEDLVTGLYGPKGIALDLQAGRMYWTEFSDRIQRANLDGSNVEELLTTAADSLFLNAIALDLQRGKMYWTNSDYFFFEEGGKIQRANLDGSAIEDVVVAPPFRGLPNWIALDVGAGKMYWTALIQGNIQRANLDGSGAEDLVTGLPDLRGIGLDLGRVEIPTVSGWGLVAMVVLFLTVGIVVLGRRRSRV